MNFLKIFSTHYAFLISQIELQNACLDKEKTQLRAQPKPCSKICLEWYKWLVNDFLVVAHSAMTDH